MSEISYCSVLSRDREELLIGTASNFNKLLLLEYNRAWTEKPFIDSKIHASVKKYLADFLILRNVKLLLIKNEHSHEAGKHIYAYNLSPGKNYYNSLLIQNYEDILDINLDSLFENDIQRAHEALYLVCTNGKKDKCCSKFGLPVYHELVKKTKNVWQCTHVGGDRFAPNVIVLPASLFFGHITKNEIDDFIKAAETSEVYYPKYRGRSIYKNYEQAAEYFLLKHLNNFSINALQLVSAKKTDAVYSSVTFCDKANNVVYEVNLQKDLSENAAFLTCTAEKPGHIPIFKLLSIDKK